MQIILKHQKGRTKVHKVHISGPQTPDNTQIKLPCLKTLLNNLLNLSCSKLPTPRNDLPQTPNHLFKHKFYLGLLQTHHLTLYMA